MKPLVLVLGLLALRLVRRRPAGRGRTLLTLSLATFISGELFCAVDVYVRRRMTLFDEGCHDALMALAFGLFALGSYVYARETSRFLNVRCERNEGCGLSAAECPESSSYGPMIGWLLAGTAVTAVIPVLAQPGVLKALLPVGAGALSFSFYRLVLVHFFHPQAVLTAFIEELLEALFLVLVLVGFRKPASGPSPALRSSGS